MKSKDDHDHMSHDDQMAMGNAVTILQGADQPAVPPKASIPVPPTQPQRSADKMEKPTDKIESKPEARPAEPPRPQRVAPEPLPEASNATQIYLPPGHGLAAPVPTPSLQPAAQPRAQAAPQPQRSPAAGPTQQIAPVVGFLVVVDGPGRGNYRAIYAGANTIGRNASQRIPIDFGDDTISGDQQAFLVYDARMRQFQLVPNLGRPNLVHLNEQALLTNAVLKVHDKVTMGRTTLLFMPLCGQDFDWADVA